MRKDFKAQGAAAVQVAAITHLTPLTQDVQREHNVQTAHKPQVKRQRFNMEYDPGNLEHLQIMARIEGVSITAYTNRLIAADREAKAATVAKFKKALQ